MWYLNRGNRMDMNVQQAWLEGATGKGVSVTILDDGIEKNHPDLIANYDPLASFDVNQNDNDPTPRYDLIDSNRHGRISRNPSLLLRPLKRSLNCSRQIRSAPNFPIVESQWVCLQEPAFPAEGGVCIS
jgi:hypothetical protein